MRRVLVCVLALSLTPSLAHAGPWIPDAGHGYIKLWTRWLPGFGFHDADGTTRSYGAYHELFVSTYAELGVGPHVAVWVHAPLVNTFALTDPRTQTTSVFVSPGDAAVGARVGLTQDTPWVSSVGVFTRAPIANPDPVANVYSTDAGNPQIGALRIGSGVWDLAAEASLGRSLGGNWYTASTVGAVWRSGGYAPAVQFTAEVGNRFSDRFAARFRLQGYISLGTGSAPPHLSPSGIGNGTTYTGFTLEGEYRVLPWLDVGAGVEGGIVFIRRQTGGPVIDLYLASSF